MMKSLDDFDRRILDQIQRDAAMGSGLLAERVGLSQSAVQRRLKRLHQSGAISGVTAVVDLRRIGRPTFFIVTLEIERERPELLASLKQWLATEETIQQVYYVTGAGDFMLIVTATDVDAFDVMMDRLVTQNANVRRFQTNVVLGIHKRSLFVPTLPHGKSR